MMKMFFDKNVVYILLLSLQYNSELLLSTTSKRDAIILSAMKTSTHSSNSCASGQQDAIEML